MGTTAGDSRPEERGRGNEEIKGVVVKSLKTGGGGGVEERG